MARIKLASTLNAQSQSPLLPILEGPRRIRAKILLWQILPPHKQRPHPLNLWRLKMRPPRIASRFPFRRPRPQLPMMPQIPPNHQHPQKQQKREVKISPGLLRLSSASFSTTRMSHVYNIITATSIDSILTLLIGDGRVFMARIVIFISAKEGNGRLSYEMINLLLRHTLEWFMMRLAVSGPIRVIHGIV